MQTASMAGLIETIFFIALFYYIFKFAVRLLLPVVLKKAVEKAEENMRQHQTYHNRTPNEPAYQNPQQSKPRETKKVGEYVDFEEIE
jgi:hypothetical protein